MAAKRWLAPRRRCTAALRLRHHPVGREPMTFMASTIYTVMRHDPACDGAAQARSGALLARAEDCTDD